MKKSARRKIVIRAIDISSIGKRQLILIYYLGLLLFYFEGSALVSLAPSARIT